MSPPKADDTIVTRTKPARPKSTCNSDSTPTLRPKRRAERVFKMPVRSSSSRSSRSSRSRSGPYDRPSTPKPAISRPHTPRRTLSLIEALPVEIIEQIFLHSLNLNFPRASPFLSRPVSGEHIYRALILLAFWGDEIFDGPRDKFIDRLMAPLEYVPLVIDERNQLQQDILKCRWCTLERLSEQVPTMQLLTIHRLWTQAGIITIEDQQSDFEKFLAREDDTVRVFYGRGPPEQKQAEDITAQSVHTYKLDVTPMVKTEFFGPDTETFTLLPALFLVEFPPHLLRGRRNGFTPGDVAMLEMLRMTSCNLIDGKTQLLPSCFTHLDRKALNQGIQNAIHHQNHSAMLSLLKIDEYVFRCKPEHLTRFTRYTFPSEHFLAVTRTGRDNPNLNYEFFITLLRASTESLPTDSSEIRQWAVDYIELGRQDPSAYGRYAAFAKWLMDFLLRLPLQLTARSQMFQFGLINTSRVEGRIFYEKCQRPYNEFFRSRWLPESSFRTEGHWLRKVGPGLPA
ncbi:uncharacterized protein N7515_004228 [Penicillium bovifimosum]|uniref:Uncharacterized protein n=1 Tax=Penicillium bovifimosum TaxID=126998 RepID=A0A9W9L6Z3_9EURO|nr:uncharacterized protein N7515_004228 [Penicillium bovifimosum]KAJ5139380.1 hypothetical protein N7515_004228 [Penicillium bovifimosum]